MATAQKDFDFCKCLEGIKLIDKVDSMLDKICQEKDVDKSYNYCDSYDALVEFTVSATNRIVDKNIVVALAHMVYGWMPTVLKIENKIKWNDICELISNLKEGKHLKLKNIVEEIMPLTNNSVIGASKLMHFINPKEYPIYDSRVYHALRLLHSDGKCSKKKEDSSTVNRVNKYCGFVEWVHKNKSDTTVLDKITDKLSPKFVNKEASDIRKIELLLFLYGREADED